MHGILFMKIKVRYAYLNAQCIVRFPDILSPILN